MGITFAFGNLLRRDFNGYCGLLRESCKAISQRLFGNRTIQSNGGRFYVAVPERARDVTINMPMELSKIQESLRQLGADCWLFYDHHHRDAIAYRVLGLSETMMVTRRARPVV